MYNIMANSFVYVSIILNNVRKNSKILDAILYKAPPEIRRGGICSCYHLPNLSWEPNDLTYRLQFEMGTVA